MTGTSHTTQAPQPVAKIVEWKIIREHVSDGTTPLDIKSDAVRPGWKRTVLRVSVKGENLDLSLVNIGYIDQYDGIGWYEDVSRPMGILRGVYGPMVLQVGDRLLTRFFGSGNGETLSIYAYGYEEEV